MSHSHDLCGTIPKKELLTTAQAKDRIMTGLAAMPPEDFMDFVGDTIWHYVLPRRRFNLMPGDTNGTYILVDSRPEATTT